MIKTDFAAQTPLHTPVAICRQATQPAQHPAQQTFTQIEHGKSYPHTETSHKPRPARKRAQLPRHASQETQSAPNNTEPGTRRRESSFYLNRFHPFIQSAILTFLVYFPTGFGVSSLFQFDVNFEVFLDFGFYGFCWFIFYTTRLFLLLRLAIFECCC